MRQSNRGLVGSNLEGRPESPVVFFANGLGDTILALPALRALVEMFPQRLTLVCDQGIHSSLLTELAFRKVVEAPMQRNVPDWTREFSVSDVVREVGGCDFFISLVPWYSQSLQALLSIVRPKTSIGFFDDFMIKVPLNFMQHAADLSFDLIRTLDSAFRLEDYAAAPVMDARSRQIAQTIRQLIPPKFRTLVVHADSGSNKMWPIHCFIKTLDQFLDNHNDYIVLLVGSAPQQLDTGRNSTQVVPCYGLPLGVSTSLVGLADMFLGVDSCMLHVADLHRIPGVGLFGASSPLEFGFRFSKASIVIEGKSMESIDVAPVLKALEVVASGI